MMMEDELGNKIDLRIGTKIRVSFGSHGSQTARVVRITSHGNVYVEKYQERSKRWTKPVRLYAGELIGHSFPAPPCPETLTSAPEWPDGATGKE